MAEASSAPEGQVEPTALFEKRVAISSRREAVRGGRSMGRAVHRSRRLEMAHIRVPYGPHDAPLAFQRNVSPFNLKRFETT